MDDSIFHEVEEDLQQEKLMKLWQNYGMYAIALVLAIIIGTGGTIYWRNAHYEKRVTQSQTFSQAVQLANSDNLTLALKNLRGLNEQGGEYAHLANFERANLIVQHNNENKAGAPPITEAIQIYDELAQNRKIDSKSRNLALLLSVLVQLDTGDPETLMVKLQKASGLSNPWAAMSQEAQALLAIRAGKPEQARAILKTLQQNKRTPQTVIDRLEAVLSGL